MDNFLEFLKSPVGIAIFSVVAAAIVIFVIDVNYRYLFKYVLGFLAALVALIILAIPMLVYALIIRSYLKKCGGGTILKRSYFMGAKGKLICVHTFATAAQNGKTFGKFSAYLNNSAAKNFPLLLDVLAGKMSIVGPKLTAIADSCLIEENYDDRFNARPGIVSPFSGKCDKDTTYEESFEADVRYVKHRELFYDIGILIKSLALKLRGEKLLYGECAEKTYAEALVSRGSITEADAARAARYEEETLKKYAEAKEFKRTRR